MGLASPGAGIERWVRAAQRRAGASGAAYPASRVRIAGVLAILVATASLGMISAEASVVVGGSVVDSEGRAIAGATVTMDGAAGSEARGMSGADGRWWLSGGHRIDSHTLTVSAPGFLPTPADPLRPALTVLYRAPSIAGTVVDDAGTPVPGAKITVSRPHQLTRWTREAAGDGTFSALNAFAPGRYSLAVKAADHDPYLATVQLRADATAGVRPILVRQQGVLELSSQPPGLTPLLDGHPLTGCRTPCAVEVLAGAHALAFDTELFIPWTQALTLHGRQKQAVTAKLERKFGTLDVTATSGELTIDGRSIDGGHFDGRLPTGNYLVGLSSAGAWPLLRTVTVSWDQTTRLVVSEDQNRIVPGDAAAFAAGLNTYLAGTRGEYGIYILDLATGAEWGSGQDRVMEAASDIKVPLAVHLLAQVEAGKIKLDDRIALEESDFMSGTGTLDGTAAVGDVYSVRELLTLMITISDNTAWMALRRTLTPAAIDAYAASIGAPDCHQVDANCTPRELGRIFAGLYHGTLLKPAENQLLLDLLSSTIFNERIPYYLPGTRVAHKTGADGGVMNDAGIVYLKSSPFVLSMFTVTDDGQTGINATRDVARAVARFLAR